MPGYDKYCIIPVWMREGGRLDVLGMDFDPLPVKGDPNNTSCLLFTPGPVTTMKLHSAGHIESADYQLVVTPILQRPQLPQSLQHWEHRYDGGYW